MHIPHNYLLVASEGTFPFRAPARAWRILTFATRILPATLALADIFLFLLFPKGRVLSVVEITS